MAAYRHLLKYAAVLAVTAFFAVMWGLLLRSHLTFDRPGGLQPAYDRLLGLDEEKRSTSWGIYFGEMRIGTSEVTISRDESSALSVESKTRIKLGPALRYVVGIVGELDVDFRAAVSPLRGLQYFSAESALLNTTLQGSVQDGVITLFGHVGEERIRSSIPFEADRLMGQVLSPLTALPKLEKRDVGRSWAVDIVNPLAGQIQEVMVSVEDHRQVEIGGDATEVLQLSFTSGSSRWVSWVTEEGDVLIQGTPFGLTLRREDLSAAVLRELTADAGPAGAAPSRAHP